MTQRDISDSQEPPPGPPQDEPDSPFEEEGYYKAGGLALVGVKPDWLRAIYHMMKANTHALRSLDQFSAEADLQRKWWESSIESEYDAMLAAGEAKAKEEGHPDQG